MDIDKSFISIAYYFCIILIHSISISANSTSFPSLPFRLSASSVSSVFFVPSVAIFSTNPQLFQKPFAYYTQIWKVSSSFWSLPSHQSLKSLLSPMSLPTPSQPLPIHPSSHEAVFSDSYIFRRTPH